MRLLSGLLVAVLLAGALSWLDSGLDRPLPTSRGLFGDNSGGIGLP